jgi:hypothetical protein
MAKSEPEARYSEASTKRLLSDVFVFRPACKIVWKDELSGKGDKHENSDDFRRVAIAGSR